MPDGMTSNELKKIMPLLARHEGVWEGTYRSEEHTSELQSPVPISYAVFCVKKKKKKVRHVD